MKMFTVLILIFGLVGCATSKEVQEADRSVAAEATEPVPPTPAKMLAPPSPAIMACRDLKPSQECSFFNAKKKNVVGTCVKAPPHEIEELICAKAAKKEARKAAKKSK